MNKPVSVKHDLPEIQSVRRFQLIKAGTLKPKPLDWQIEHLFERDTTLLIFGDPGSAKTFKALDISCCIATGVDFHGRRVKQGPVVYICGEGINGIARRIQAWSIRNNTDLSDSPLFISTMPAALCELTEAVAVMNAIDEVAEIPAFVVIDTLARNFGGDENSSTDMSAFIQCIDSLRATYDGCTICLVHHSGHAVKTRARGSSVLQGAIDTAYSMTRHASGKIVVENRKMKDGPIPEPFAFEIRTVELDLLNEDGTQATSAVLRLTELPTELAKVTGKWQKAALEKLHELHQQHKENLTQSGHDPDQAKVSIDDWRQSCQTADMPRNRFHEAKNRLVATGQVEINNPYARPASGSPVRPVT